MGNFGGIALVDSALWRILLRTALFQLIPTAARVRLNEGVFDVRRPWSATPCVCRIQVQRIKG